jgi:hypothetical protein
MVETRHAERRLSEELAETRTQFRENLLLLRRELDLRGHVISSIRNHTFEWITSAFITGWLLSRLPARKKKIYYDLNHQEAKAPGRKTRDKLGKMVWNTFKPVIAAYLAKELAEKTATPKDKTPEKAAYIG